MSFPCTSCGQCCRMVMLSVSMAKEVLASGYDHPQVVETANFPFSAKEDGSCEKLGDDGRCTVYESRPDICNIDKYHEKYEAEKDKDTYYFNTAATCNMMIKDAGLDDKYLVILKK